MKLPYVSFIATAQYYKDKYAVIYKSTNNQIQSLTYEQINIQSKNLAQRLSLDYKLGPQSIVAVSLREMPSYIISLFAIWQIGAVYMPMDCTQRDGVKSRVRKAGAKLLLCEQDDVADYVCLESEQIIVASFVPLENKTISQSPEEHTIYQADKNDPAYIYSSSGTTHEPKLILNTFSGLADRVEDIAKRTGIGPGMGILGYCSPDFDANLLDTLLALCNGACLYLVNAEIRKNVNRLPELFSLAND